jgi:hypothetical protein
MINVSNYLSVILHRGSRSDPAKGLALNSACGLDSPECQPVMNLKGIGLSERLAWYNVHNGTSQGG